MSRIDLDAHVAKAVHMTQLINEQARMLANERLYGKLFLMQLEAPSIARSVLPGQFVHMKIPGIEGHILRRPFSVYDANKDTGVLDILYQDVGYGSHAMSLKDPATESAPFELIGPVGTPWSAAHWDEGCKGKHVLLVGGGVGSAPLFMLMHHLFSIGAIVDVVLGAQTRDALVTCARYTDILGREPFCSTDDGSYGRAGFATSLVEDRLNEGSSIDGEPYDYAAVCGPAPLMRIASKLIVDAGIPCEVSLEKRMACGIGACLSCVVETDEGKKRVCVDGPVFDARKVRI